MGLCGRHLFVQLDDFALQLCDVGLDLRIRSPRVKYLIHTILEESSAAAANLPDRRLQLLHRDGDLTSGATDQGDGD